MLRARRSRGRARSCRPSSASSDRPAQRAFAGDLRFAAFAVQHRVVEAVGDEGGGGLGSGCAEGRRACKRGRWRGRGRTQTCTDCQARCRDPSVSLRSHLDVSTLLALAQLAAQRLPVSVFGISVDEDDLARRLVDGELGRGSARSARASSASAPARSDDVGAHGFAAVGVGHADHAASRTAGWRKSASSTSRGQTL